MRLLMCQLAQTSRAGRDERIMTSFHKIAGAMFIAARAGRGGGLLLLPFFLVFAGVFWVIGRLGSLLIGAVSGLAPSAAKVTKRGK